MYNEKDLKDINAQLLKYTVMTCVLAAAVITWFVLGCVNRHRFSVYGAGCVFWAVNVFMFGLFIIPVMRYRRFLKDMTMGLSREIACTILQVEEKEDLQDGVRVLPVHIKLRDEDDTRIVYLNVSKREGFPKSGDEATLVCYGRHIRSVQ